MIGPGAAFEPPFQLPPYAHLPGRNPRHAAEVFAAIKAATPDATRSEDADRNVAWRHGLALLARGYFWECHEVLEKVWLHAAPNSRERVLVQAVIQIANGALKREMGRDRAARRLGEIAMSRLAELPRGAPVMGIEIDELKLLAMALRDGGRLSG